MERLQIASPLFILREKCAEDLFGVLDRISGAGFDGVEFIGFFNRAPEEIRVKLNALGLRAVGNHVPYGEFAANPEKVISNHKTVGCEYITVGAPGPDGMPGGRGYAETLETLNRLGRLTNEAGMRLLFHNHSGEMELAPNGKSHLENLMDDTDPDSLLLEPDLGWIQIGGGDPAHILKKYLNRCPVVHFKDFLPADDGYVFMPTGYGAVDSASLYGMCRKSAAGVKWYVMDHDCAYERDIFDDLTLSLTYFKNLARLIG